MMATLLKLKWDVLPHAAYNPDLAPSDYHPFRPMKRFLGGKRLQNNGEVIAGVQRWIHEPPKPSLKLELRSFQKHQRLSTSRGSVRARRLESLATPLKAPHILKIYLFFIPDIVAFLRSITVCYIVPK
jgi:hypothetical protein